MKKPHEKVEVLVQSNVPRQKVEKLWLVQYFTTRRHSRTLYLPLPADVCRMFDIQKGDVVKAMILELRKAPRPDEPLREISEGESAKDDGEL